MILQLIVADGQQWYWVCYGGEVMSDPVLMTTVRDLLTGTFRASVMDLEDLDLNIENYPLYVFWYGSTALYVGQAKNSLKRVEEHLGVGPGNVTTIGLLLVANYPRAYDWEVWFLTVAYVTEVRRKSWSGYHYLFLEKDLAQLLTVNRAERFLIGHYRPCLNIAYRVGPKRHLPADCIVPCNELPDGLSWTSEQGPLYSYTVSYQAFDWAELENKQYTVTMRAPAMKMCRGLAAQILGYEPERLWVRRQEAEPNLYYPRLKKGDSKVDVDVQDGQDNWDKNQQQRWPEEPNA